MQQANIAYKIPDEVFLAWKPPDNISVPDWVEKNLKLSDKMSAEPGPFRIHRTPYVGGPLKALGDLFIEEIVLVWGRQLGKSTGIQYAFACYVIAQDPGPATFLLPTRDKAKEISETKLDPIFRACPEVMNRMPDNLDDYTKLRMNFKTMVFAMAWAGSDTQTTTRSNRYLFVDEADEIDKAVGENAIDPIKGIEQTTTTFSNRKIVKTSTPTTPEGNIWQALKQCQYVFEYWLPCLHCEAKQILYWENVRFGENHDPVVVEEMAYYECEQCQKKISNLDKIRMLTKGEWRARTSPEPCEQIMKGIRARMEETISLDDVLKLRKAKTIGFHLPKWYSPFFGGTFGVIAKEYLEAERIKEDGEDFAPMRNWQMYNAATPWGDPEILGDEKELEANKINLPRYVCPQGTIALTAGIDPGQRGFWFVVLAWRKGFSSHLIDYGWMPGDYQTSGINDFVMKRYAIEGEGREIGIAKIGIDTGGSEYSDSDATMTEAAYRWIRGLNSIRVFGTKGQSWETVKHIRETRLDKMPGTGNEIIKGGLILIQMNTTELKKDIWARIKIAEGQSGRFTFNRDTEEDYFRHLTAESYELQRDNKKKWVRKRAANHLFDATVIAFAMADPEFRNGIRLIRPAPTGGESGKMPPMNPVTKKPRGEWGRRW